MFVTMIRALKLTLIAAAVAAFALPTSAAAQGGFTVDGGLAKQGEKLWKSRGCSGCHVIGKKAGGPDVVGVVNRRGVDWVRRWLKNTTEMLETDETAMALLAEWNNTKMPQIKLSDSEIEALIHYMASAK